MLHRIGILSNQTDSEGFLNQELKPFWQKILLVTKVQFLQLFQIQYAHTVAFQMNCAQE